MRLVFLTLASLPLFFYLVITHFLHDRFLSAPNVVERCWRNSLREVRDFLIFVWKPRDLNSPRQSPAVPRWLLLQFLLLELTEFTPLLQTALSSSKAMTRSQGTLVERIRKCTKEIRDLVHKEFWWLHLSWLQERQCQTAVFHYLFVFNFSYVCHSRG